MFRLLGPRSGEVSPGAPRVLSQADAGSGKGVAVPEEKKYAAVEGKALKPCPFSHRSCWSAPLYILQLKHELSRSCVQDRMAPSRRDFRERSEDKVALRNPRMRQGKISPTQNKAAIVEYVEIEGTRTPPDRPPASGFPLNHMQPRQKRLRWKTRFNRGNCVDEIGLVWPPERFGFVQRRRFDQSHTVAVQFSQGARNGLTRRPPRPRHIGTQCDKYHDCA